ncbi:MAG: ParA family protein [Legionellales bacterium]|nr:ParA family protein [Legionellales bacterium]
MTKVIVAATNKGGDGKTKTSILLAEYLATLKKKKVLAIDLDPQCNLSHKFLDMEIDPVESQGKMPPIHPSYVEEKQFNPEWNGRSSIADIFYGDSVLPYSTHFDMLDIAPGYAIKLLEAEAVRKSEVKNKVHNQLHLFISDPTLQETYDIVLIDTAPSKGPLTVSAIKAASHIIIPSQMEQNSIQGIYGMLQLWKQEALQRDRARPLELIGILPNKIRDINLHKDLLEELKNADFIGEYVMEHKLKLRSIYAEFDSEGAEPESIFSLSDSNIAKQEAMQVCDFIYNKVFPND